MAIAKFQTLTTAGALKIVYQREGVVIYEVTG